MRSEQCKEMLCEDLWSHEEVYVLVKSESSMIKQISCKCEVFWKDPERSQAIVCKAAVLLV